MNALLSIDNCNDCVFCKRHCYSVVAVPFITKTMPVHDDIKTKYGNAPAKLTPISYQEGLLQQKQSQSPTPANGNPYSPENLMRQQGEANTPSAPSSNNYPIVRV